MRSRAPYVSSTRQQHPSSGARKLSLVVHASRKEVTLLDYGAGNVRSVRNAIMKLGYSIKDVSVHVIFTCLHECARTSSHLCFLNHAAKVEKPSDIASAEKLIFPGVGSFGQAMRILKQKEMVEPLKDYVDVRRSC